MDGEAGPPPGGAGLYPVPPARRGPLGPGRRPGSRTMTRTPTNPARRAARSELPARLHSRPGSRRPLALLAAAWALGVGCTLPSLEPVPRRERGAPGVAQASSAGPVSPAAVVQEDQTRILWRGEPLEVELAPWSSIALDGGPAPPAAGTEGEPWVLADLVLEAADGGVASAVLRSNGDRLDLPLSALRLAPPASARRGAARTQTAAWWAPGAQDPPAAGGRAGQADPGENRAGLPDRHSALFGERESERVEGELIERESGEAPGAPVVVRLRSANNHFHRVLLAPAEFLAARELRLAPGTPLAVRGVRTRDARGALLVARELELEGRTAALRREDGVPLWVPRPEPEPAPAPDPAPGAGEGAGEEPGEREPPRPAPPPAPAPDVRPAERPELSPGSPLARDGRLSALALLGARLELRAAGDGPPRELAVNGLVLDLVSESVPYLALRSPANGEESWLWVPWEALAWQAGRAHLTLPALAGDALPPSGGVDARSLLPADAVLERARRFWLEDR